MASNKDYKDKVLKLFRKADANGDGSIDEDELRVILTGVGLSAEDVPAIFAAADANHDGRIDYAEFVQWVWGSSPGEASKLVIPDAEPENGAQQLEEVLEQIFKCFDADQDGALEREEYLEGWEKLSEILDESFGPMQRRKKMAWYKEAGAEGTVESGMYLQKAPWRAAYVKTASEASGFSEAEPGKLSAWIWGSYGQRFVHACFPPAEDPDAVEEPLSLPPGPEYPLTIPATELAAKIEQAKALRRRVLILSSGCYEVVQTYLRYRIPDNLTLLGKTVSPKGKDYIKSMLSEAMEYMGLCAAVHLEMADCSCDWKSLSAEIPDEFPADIFSGALWTPAKAAKMGFVTEGHKQTINNDPEKWKDFTVVISSSFDVEGATAAGLPDKIPHYSELAILVIDPNSVAKD